MRKLLWISKSAPYDKVSHAGGKTHNYYVKKISSDNDIDMMLVSMIKKWEFNNLDLDTYGIHNRITIYPESGIKWVWRRILDLESVCNPWNRNGGLTRNFEVFSICKQLKLLKNNGYMPDVIILEWTQIILLSKKIKAIFPNASIIGIEVDVAFLGFQRKYELEQSFIKKWFRKVQCGQLKKKELLALKKLDVCAVNNIKDQKIIINEGIDRKNTIVLTPYFDSYQHVERRPERKAIIFYGAMSRSENWKSAIWFCKKVMPKIVDLPLEFWIIGSRPNPELKKYEDDKIKILGYVEKIEPYFSTALCMVCPLLLGAGVKVKVIEGMSAGMPVLASKIAIEGIYAKEGKDYLQCEIPEEFDQMIRYLYDNPDICIQIGNNARKFIKNNYNTDNDVNMLKQIVLSGLSS